MSNDENQEVTEEQESAEQNKEKRLDILSKEINKLVDDYENTLSMHVTCHAFLGNANLTMAEFLKLDKGSIINLNKAAGEGADFYINDRIIGKGEVMVYERSLAVRLNEIFSHDAIIYYFFDGAT